MESLIYSARLPCLFSSCVCVCLEFVALFILLRLGGLSKYFLQVAANFACVLCRIQKINIFAATVLCAAREKKTVSLPHLVFHAKEKKIFFLFNEK